jgi:FlaA1/EpsC-like NDP-sugar epimerase
MALENKTILVTGGTGSFGRRFTDLVLVCDETRDFVGRLMEKRQSPPSYYNFP